jgi:PilZ domain
MYEDVQSVKRAAERKRIKIAVTVVIEGDEAEYRSTTFDLSAYGLRLQSDVPLRPGQPVRLLLATHPNSLLKARVVWVGKADSAQAGQAGIEFVTPRTGPVC